MKQISAEIVLDSYNGENRITTAVVTFHRFLLPEWNTHRVFSRNTASSRAIPVSKMIEEVRNNPALPIFWGKNKSGMQAYEELKLNDLYGAKDYWDEARLAAIEYAEAASKCNLHKQLTNRLIEPYMWTTVIVTSTEWDNFFKLRRPPGGVMDPQFPAQPEMQVLAIELHKAINNSDPVLLHHGEWHIPFIRPEDGELNLQEKIRVSAGRCARVSYLTHDGIRDVKKDLELAEKLIADKHMSPLEHQARCMADNLSYANFKGWRQFRRYVEMEASITS